MTTTEYKKIEINGMKMRNLFNTKINRACQPQ
jgi:hypothetical protein